MSTTNSKHFSLQQVRPARVSLLIGQNGPCKDCLVADLIHLHPNQDPRPAMVIGATPARRAMYEKLKLRIVDENSENALKDLREWTYETMRTAARQGDARSVALTTLVVDEGGSFYSHVGSILWNNRSLGIHVIWLLNLDRVNFHYRHISISHADYVFFFADPDVEHREKVHNAFYFPDPDFCSRFESATKHGGCLVRDRVVLPNEGVPVIFDYQPFGNTMHVLQSLRQFSKP